MSMQVSYEYRHQVFCPEQGVCLCQWEPRVTALLFMPIRQTRGLSEVAGYWDIGGCCVLSWQLDAHIHAHFLYSLAQHPRNNHVGPGPC